MYKLVQNYLQDSEYEYAKEYNSLSEAQKDINEYIQEDKERGESHNYTVIDKDGEDIEEKQDELFRAMAMNAMQDIGLTEDEAIRELEDLAI
jgi:hypothetical protein